MHAAAPPNLSPLKRLFRPGAVTSGRIRHPPLDGDLVRMPLVDIDRGGNKGKNCLISPLRPELHAMRPFATLLAAAAFLLHTGLGCCAHHGHSSRPASESSQAEHTHHDGSHGHHHAPPSEPASPPHDDCHESHCHVVIAGHVSPPDINDCPSWLAGVVISAADELNQGACPLHQMAHAPDEHRPLPLRAHLRLAVLLI